MDSLLRSMLVRALQWCWHLQLRYFCYAQFDSILVRCESGWGLRCVIVYGLDSCVCKTASLTASLTPLLCFAFFDSTRVYAMCLCFVPRVLGPSPRRCLDSFEAWTRWPPPTHPSRVGWGSGRGAGGAGNGYGVVSHLASYCRSGLQAIASDAASVTQDMLLEALGGITPQITSAMLDFYSSFAAKHSGLV
jgi:hypothetical protein